MSETKIIAVTRGETAEKTPGQIQTNIVEKKEAKTGGWSWWDTLFLTVSTVTLSETAGWVLGFYDYGWNALRAPFRAISHSYYGPVVGIFTLTIVGIIAMYIWDKALSWKTCRKWLIGEAMLLATACIIMTLFPNFSMRNTITAKFGNGGGHQTNSIATQTQLFKKGRYTIQVADISNWIEPDGEIKTLGSFNNDFVMIDPKGNMYSPWEPHKWPKKDFVFQILADTPQKISLVVGPKKKEVKKT